VTVLSLLSAASSMAMRHAMQVNCCVSRASERLICKRECLPNVLRVIFCWLLVQTLATLLQEACMEQYVPEPKYI